MKSKAATALCLGRTFTLGIALLLGLSSAAASPLDGLAKGLEAQAPYFLSIPAGDRASALSRIKVYLAQGDLQTRAGIAALLQEGLFATRKDEARENQALELLALLCLRVDAKGDSMLSAIALANAWPWSIADEETRGAIVEDCVAQVLLYRAIAAWQEAADFAYSIRLYPLVAKLLWADRLGSSYWTMTEALRLSGKGKLDLGLYRDFLDRPEKLADLHGLIMDEGLASASITETCTALEAYVHATRTYRSSMENLEDFAARGIFTEEDLAAARAEKEAGGYVREWRGKMRRWDDFVWFNYQWELFEKTGRFEGDCGTTTNVQMAFYRACGIAPVSLQYINPEGVAAWTHNFPGYYHPAMGRILAIQKPLFISDEGTPVEAAIATFLHYTKPIWHPRKQSAKWESLAIAKGRKATNYAFYPGELADQKKIAALLSIGWEMPAFEKSLWGDAGYTSGVIFTAARSPASFADTDGDGLPDPLEEALGTASTKADSDGDGRADRWEIEYGFTPLKKGDVPADMIALDGLASRAEYGVDPSSASYAKDPKKDYASTKYVYDIAWFQAAIAGGRLRLAAGFHSPIAQNGIKVHSIMLVERGGKERKLWAQWVNSGYSQIYVMAEGEVFEKLGSVGLEGAWVTEAEFAIPLPYFAGARGLWVRYFGCGYYKGADQVTDDYSEFVSISLSERDEAALLSRGGTFGAGSADPHGDPKRALAWESPDIGQVAASRLEGPEGPLLALRVRHENRVADLPYGIKNVLFRSASGKDYLWVQWWDPTSGGIWAWPDGGTPKETGIEWKGFASFLAGKDALFALPLPLLESLGFGEGASFQFHSGGLKKDGSWLSDDDLSEWMGMP